MEAKDVAKKVFLQAQKKHKKLKSTLRQAYEGLGVLQGIKFLDMDVSLSLKSGLRHAEHEYDKSEYSFDRNVGDGLMELKGLFSKIIDKEVFCFSYHWKTLGAYILNPSHISEQLNDFMRLNEDELWLWSTDFNNSLTIIGDRTGSGDRLNQLSVYVHGDRWSKLMGSNG